MAEWITNGSYSIMNWAKNLEEGALQQAINAAQLPCIFRHVAIMPDGHQGMGFPIGGVMALKDAVCPNAIGVDIGCGMIALKTNVNSEVFKDMRIRREFQQLAKSRIPVGEGKCHSACQKWERFDEFKEASNIRGGGDGAIEMCLPGELDMRNLGTLGGGNHFCELQKSDSGGTCWLMIHSGSRNLGHRIERYFHEKAKEACKRYFVALPDEDLAFLPVCGGEYTKDGDNYLWYMNFALEYAKESRRRMMEAMYESFAEVCSGLGVECKEEFRLDIHHNYAALESHDGKNVWVHRKGATSAKEGELGIIPGSMGTASYIVEGLGNHKSFCSCSHGAGRKMSRTAACQNLTVEECNKAMEGIVCDRWSKMKRGKSAGKVDLSEAPGAYKDIEDVIANEYDLIIPKIRLTPMANIKG